MKFIVNVRNRRSNYSRQIVAGFSMLQAQGAKVSFCEKAELQNKLCAEIEVLVDGKRIVYDLADGYNNYHSFDAYDHSLDDVDICFKASVREDYHVSMKNRNKIHVLGPRYSATCKNSWNDMIDMHNTDRHELIKALLYRIPYTKHSIQDYYYDRFECEPLILNDEPKVFFYTRLWNPKIASSKSSQNIDLDGETVEKRIERKNIEYAELSELRAGLVCALKKEFGNRFIGGIAPDDYTVKTYPDLLGPDLSRRSLYTKNMHSAEICVNTWGTHKCFNFSFGEELAASRAIVTQRPFYKVPDYLSDGINFNSYATIYECLEAVSKLIDDRAAIETMMFNNHLYYTDHLRPDKYVLDTLKIAGIAL